MKVATATLLARPAGGAERGRFLLIAAATTLTGALLMAAARISRLTVEANRGSGVVYGIPSEGGLSLYVAERGLRPGVVLGAVLLAVPLLALAVQALRVGSLARERRMASMRLAGATPGEVRGIAAAEAGMGAATGGVLAGPAYVLLWLALGALPPPGLRLLPAPDWFDPLIWVIFVIVSGACGALAGGIVHRRVLVDPLGVRRRATVRTRKRASLVGLLVGMVFVVGAALYAAQFSPFYVMVAVILGVLVFAFGLAPWVARLAGRRLASRGGAQQLLAGRRITADPASTGRVVGVLMVCGLALGVEAALAADVLAARGHTGGTLGFYFTGYAIAAAGVLLAACVAVLTLVVGAADQLLDARRPLASLAALGVEEPILAGVLRLQISAAVVPAVIGGVLVGGVAGAAIYGLSTDLRVLTLTGIAALIAWASVWCAARLAARVLRPWLRAAIDPENLRVA